MSTLAFPPAVIGAPRAVHDPRTEIRIGGAIIGLFLFGFIGWSAMVRLDAAVHSPGVVRVAGNRQAVQSLAGGVVSTIHVREGDRVKAGQLLVEFATMDALAQERSLANRVFGLQAEIARINTERAGGDRVSAPPEWAAFTAEDRRDADRALASEQTNLNAERTLLASERAVLQQRIVQTGNQIEGYRQRQASNTRQRAFNEDELGSVERLYAQGYATKTRVLSLRKSGAAIEGEMGANTAEVARLSASAGETRMQMMQLSDQRRQENSDRLRTAETELQTVLPQWKAAKDQLELTRVRAPVSGMVIGLTANTVGGVAQAGQKLMEIVPTEGALVIEAQVALADANALRPGQKADVRLVAMREHNVPLLHGTISRVSADSLTDDRTGRSFYTATVSIPRAELDHVSQEAGVDGTVKPGTPVDVTVPLKRRTALQYLIGPLTDRFAGSFGEN